MTVRYDHLQIYYFTGTGNSYRAGQWLAESAEQHGLMTRVEAIDRADPPQTPAEGTLTGFLAPTHAFSAPLAMINFILHLPRGAGRDVFVILTRGKTRIGKFSLQGLEGSGAYLLALLLAIKGYHVRAAFGLDMPATWAVVAPSLTEISAASILAESRVQMQALMEKLLSGRTVFRGFIELFLGMLLLPLTLAYWAMGHFFLAKLFYAGAKCNGCGLCAQSCPLKAIKMHADRPYWTYLCESCTRCMTFCPQQAVEASYPFGLMLVFITAIPAVSVLLDPLARAVTSAVGISGPVLEWVIHYPYQLLSIALAYGMFWLLMRVPVANRMFTFFTPTRFYRRYREPGTHLGQISKKK